MLPGVSRETHGRLEAYLGELATWQRAVNLVGPATLADAWQRHVVDSAQFAGLADGAIWADLGSGAGLPGVIVAILRPELELRLFEADARRCAFLRHVASQLSLSIEVVEGRIERARERLLGVDVVSARAVASVPALLELSYPALSRGAVALFAKGRRYGEELTEASRSWTFQVDAIVSRTDPDGRILRLRDVSRRT